MTGACDGLLSMILSNNQLSYSSKCGKLLQVLKLNLLGDLIQ